MGQKKEKVRVVVMIFIDGLSRIIILLLIKYYVQTATQSKDIGIKSGEINIVGANLYKTNYSMFI
jgi:hypothetical protein